jgi:hypothetical protein
MIKGNEPINSIPDLNNHPSSWYGLTKREYFAAMAMQSYLTPCNGWLNVNDLEEAARRSTIAADALINALNETK